MLRLGHHRSAPNLYRDDQFCCIAARSPGRIGKKVSSLLTSQVTIVYRNLLKSLPIPDLHCSPKTLYLLPSAGPWEVIGRIARRAPYTITIQQEPSHTLHVLLTHLG